MRPATRSADGSSVTWRQVIAWRLDRHGLTLRAPPMQGLGVAARLCGLHAQLMSSAELSLWARVERVDRATVSQALWEERALVKTWAMRGTLHLLPAQDFPVWQAALSGYRHMRQASWLRGFGLTGDELETLVRGVASALDGPPLTRDELAAAVAAGTGSARLGDKLRGSWGSLLKPAAYRGYLCFAPGVGGKVRFTRPDRWLGRWSAPDPTEALREAARRYLAVSGPVTRADLGRWWGLAPPAAGRLLDSLGAEVTVLEVEGVPMCLLAKDAATLRAAPAGPAASTPTVRLLPAFDQYVVAASRHAERVMPVGTREQVYRNQGWLSPVLLVDGYMAGVWRHERSGSRLRVMIEPFDALTPAARAGAEDEAGRLALWAGAPVDVAWIT
ncbi:MAG: winged helix DNA-binding domain-containing protein [Frankiaceae bacterium]